MGRVTGKEKPIDGQKLREVRLSGKRSLREVAALLGKTQATVTSWEYGHHQPDRLSRIALIEVFGTDFSRNRGPE